MINFFNMQQRLNYGEVESHPERVSNIKPFINEYKWKGINYPSKIDDWKTFKKNNLIVAVNILYIKEEEICPAYISKINLNCEKHNSITDSKRRENKNGMILQ